MTDEEYLTIQHQVGLLSGLIAELDLAGFLDRISLADSIGPIMDPTLYRKAAGEMHHIQDLAQALFEAQGKIKRVIQEIQP